MKVDVDVNLNIEFIGLIIVISVQKCKAYPGVAGSR
jgi:hypothetical protein